MSNKALLLILDGWGIAKNKEVSAIDNAKTPFIDGLYDTVPNSRLEASGSAVGLPDGQMGNSEVGHLNLGAGRIVFQNLEKINQAFKTKEIVKNKQIQKLISDYHEFKKPIHLFGLVSDGGVHSHINHLLGLIDLLEAENIQEYYIHCFTDGRDCDPNSGINHIKKVQDYLKNKNGKIASVIGRYFSMDRDNRWERVKKSYHLLVHGAAEKQTQNIEETIQEFYNNSITDEFLEPICLVDKNNQPIATIKKGDTVFCFNFRTDRGREISSALTQKAYPKYEMHPLSLNYYTMTKYDDTFKNVQVIFESNNLKNTLGEVLENAHKKQIRIAETEKYPHVTFFFSGGRETEFKGESRILCPSPKVATYDLKPEMSAYEIKDSILPELEKSEADFICLNFANPDMVGHTGILEAAIKACETVDFCTKEVAETAVKNGYTVFILADHGNADCMRNEDGSSHTAHTTQPVPFFVMGNSKIKYLENGKLGDVAPTILSVLNINKPDEMTGLNLIRL